MLCRSCVYSIHCYWVMMYSSKTSMLSGSTKIGIRWSSFKTSRPTLVTLMSSSNMMGLIASDMPPTLPILDYSTHAPTNEHNICSRRCCIIPIWSSRGILNSRHSSNCLQNIVHYSVSMSKFWGVALKCSQVRGSACPACHCQRHPLVADFLPLDPSYRRITLILGGYHYHRNDAFMKKFVKRETKSYVFHMWVYFNGIWFSTIFPNTNSEDCPIYPIWQVMDREQG